MIRGIKGLQDENPEILYPLRINRKSILTYFKIGFWDGLSPDVGGGLFLTMIRRIKRLQDYKNP